MFIAKDNPTNVTNDQPNLGTRATFPERENQNSNMYAYLCINEKVVHSMFSSAAPAATPNDDFTKMVLICASFIVSSGTCLEDDIPAHWKYPLDFLKNKFDRIVQCAELYEQVSYDLIRTYADLYKISLHIQIHIGQEHTMVNEEYFLQPNFNLRPYSFPSNALIDYDVEERKLTPRFIHENEKRRTIFRFDEVRNPSFIRSITCQATQSSKLHPITFSLTRTKYFSTF